MKYTNEKKITDLVASFEDASITRDLWKHAEHLVVALYYVNKCDDFDVACERMRRGLFNLLTTGFKVDLTKEMPYHETLTLFWMRTVADFNASKNGASLRDKANDLVESLDKDYPLKFYSRTYLFSDEARERFVAPDLAQGQSIEPVIAEIPKA